MPTEKVPGAQEAHTLPATNSPDMQLHSTKSLVSQKPRAPTYLSTVVLATPVVPVDEPEPADPVEELDAAPAPVEDEGPAPVDDDGPLPPVDEDEAVAFGQIAEPFVVAVAHGKQLAWPALGWYSSTGHTVTNPCSATTQQCVTHEYRTSG